MEFSNEDQKLDYITVDRNVYVHKQIEKRNGILYMRMKKRVVRSA